MILTAIALHAKKKKLIKREPNLLRRKILENVASESYQNINLGSRYFQLSPFLKRPG